MVYKVGSAVGAVGTVGGIGGTVVMANRETEPTKEQALKALSKETEIKVSTVVSAIPGIGEKAIDETKADSKDKKALEKIKVKTKRAEVEKLTDAEIKELKGFLETKEATGGTTKNNVCELIQKELFRRLAEKEFKFEESKDSDFEKAVLACWRKN